MLVLVAGESWVAHTAAKGPLTRLLGYNRFISRDHSTVVASVAGDPLLVVGTFGLGPVASFASDCAPHWASREFLEWESFGQLFSNVLRWVSQSDTETE